MSHQAQAINRHFFSHANYQMLFSLLQGTLNSRFNMEISPSVQECIKNELLETMQHTFKNKASIRVDSPVTLEEYNLLLNKKVLDRAMKKIPQVVQQNMSCRPKVSPKMQDNVDEAFDKLQVERNQQPVRPKNPFTTQTQPPKMVPSYDSTTSMQNSALGSTASNQNRNEQTKQVKALAGDNLQALSLGTYNDTDSNLNFLTNSNVPTLSLSETIKQFNDESQEQNAIGDSFVKSLEEKIRMRDEEFRKNSTLTPQQDAVLKAQIQHDKEEAIKNSYPMDGETLNKDLPQSLNDNSLALLSEANKNAVPNKEVRWVEKTTTIQLNSADRKHKDENRHDYTIDTSLFSESIKHIVAIKVRSLVIPLETDPAKPEVHFSQYVTVEIPELTTHNVGSNSKLQYSQCILYQCKRIETSARNGRGWVVLHNENDTMNVYEKNIMRQLPRQLTIRILGSNGEIYESDAVDYGADTDLTADYDANDRVREFNPDGSVKTNSSKTAAAGAGPWLNLSLQNTLTIDVVSRIPLVE